MNANTNVGINTLGYYNSVNSQRRPPQNINVAPTSVILIPTRTCTRARSYKQPDGVLVLLPEQLFGYGLGNGNGGGDNKLMERINYMIHMMEEQYEKTNNITEEFILYVLWVYYDIYRGFV
jgi:hypothetical protein